MPRKGQKTGYTFNCENCGEEVYQPKTQYEKAKHHFCSNKCQKEYQHRDLFENRKCEICNKIFPVSKKSTQRFCSIQCQGKWQSTQVGDLNPRSNKIQCSCTYCNKPIKVQPCNYNNYENHFCDENCRKKWYAEVFSQNEEWKEQSKKRAISILSNGLINTATKPQIMINKLLDNMNISYRNEENFVYYSIDNYLYDYNLAIEVMGDFWHSNPQKYLYDELKDIQRKRIPKDKAKHTYMINQYGINILYLWESDIYENIDVCEKLIKNYIDNNGTLDDYHSFNYFIHKDELMLKSNLIIPYQEINAA